MHDANLVRVLGRQSNSRVGGVNLATVVKGVDAIRAQLLALAGSGVRSAIVDAVFDRDLEAIGVAALDHGLSVGASGLGLGLAKGLVSAGKAQPGRSDTFASASPVGGPVACLAGSCSQMTLAQVAAAKRIMPTLQLDPESLISRSIGIDDALRWASERLASGPILIASSAPPAAVAALQARHGGDLVGRAIEDAMATIAAGLVDRGVRRFVVAGGETSGAVVDELGVPAFLVGQEIAPGVPVLRTVGDRSGDMIFALKSGNFGGVDFFGDALKLIA